MEKKPQIKTGLFGGSFNPIHTGHLALANYLCEYGGLEEVWFLVTPQNPFKQNETLLDDHLRLEMVEAAVAGYPHFRASDFEFRLPRPSYTIHTLDKLAEQYPDREFHLIIGADNWQAFDRWRSPEEIIRRHHILVYPRQGYPLEDTASLPPHVRVVQTPPYRNQFDLYPQRYPGRKRPALFPASGSIQNYSGKRIVPIIISFCATPPAPPRSA